MSDSTTPPADAPGPTRAPAVSVIVPVHLAGSTIEACLKSLFSQTLAPARFEVLLVFHGPDDGARATAQRLSTSHGEHGLVFLDSEPASAASARNVGLDRAAGDNVTFVDADGWVSPEYLEELLAAADGLHVPAAGIADVAPDGTTNDDTPVMRELARSRAPLVEFHRLRHHSSLSAGKLWPRSWLAEDRFDPELGSGADVAFNGRMLAKFSHRFSSYAIAPYRGGALYHRRLAPDSESRAHHDFDFAVLRPLAVIQALTRGDQPRDRLPLTARLVADQSRIMGTYLEKNRAEGLRVLTAVARAGVPGLTISSDRTFRPIYRRTAPASSERVVLASGSASSLNRLATEVEYLAHCGITVHLAFVKGSLSSRMAVLPNHRVSIVAVPGRPRKRAKTLGARVSATGAGIRRLARRLARGVSARLLPSPTIVGIARLANPKARAALSFGPVIAVDDQLTAWGRLGETAPMPAGAVHRMVLTQAAGRPEVGADRSATIRASAELLGERPRGDQIVPPFEVWALAAWWLHRAGHRADLVRVVSAALRHFPDHEDSAGLRLLGTLGTPEAMRTEEALEATTAAAHAASVALESGDLDRAVFLLTLICELLGPYEAGMGSPSPPPCGDPERLLASLRSAAMAWRLLEGAELDEGGPPQHPITPSTVRARLLGGLRGDAEPTCMTKAPSGTLVTSYCFPPYSDVSGVVAAKRILLKNQRVDVIANAMDRIREQDETLTRIGGHLVDRYAALRTPSGFASWISVSTYADAGYELFLRWERERGPYADLYSRAQFVASHILAAKIKASRPGITWLAEFSDPLSRDVMGAVRHAPVPDADRLRDWAHHLEDRGYAAPDNNNLYQWCEALTFALADSIMFTNTSQRDLMLSQCHDQRLAARASEKAVVSPHPTLPREFYSMALSDYALPPDKVNIGYFGRFYENRGAGLVLDAFADLPADLRRRVHLHMFTPPERELTELVEAGAVGDVVSVNPYLHYLEFLNLADRMDALLINDAVSPPGHTSPFLPSKWSDYKGTATPVWGILEEGSPLDSVSGIAYRTPVGQVSAIQVTLGRIVADLARL